jgi:hypothetical protein
MYQCSVKFTKVSHHTFSLTLYLWIYSHVACQYLLHYTNCSYSMSCFIAAQLPFSSCSKSSHRSSIHNYNVLITVLSILLTWPVVLVISLVTLLPSFMFLSCVSSVNSLYCRYSQIWSKIWAMSLAQPTMLKIHHTPRLRCSSVPEGILKETLFFILKTHVSFWNLPALNMKYK